MVGFCQYAWGIISPHLFDVYTDSGQQAGFMRKKSQRRWLVGIHGVTPR
ncbi:hypothetical protein DAQ1742_02559 [Dickeya aquatica]|uniref:Uncharacterized protein n=1 Tax=Dickeya aquatica TaxID=1401087 RepID=A0A375ABT2_9GAMM|nr:hypothetical protein DAQ1742_02559 [Dickeya aquatica]